MACVLTLDDERGDRLCLVCKSLQAAEDEQHLLFDCPPYIRTYTLLLAVGSTLDV